MAHCFIYETIVNFNYPVSIIHRSDPVSIRRRHPIGYSHPLALFRREQFPPISLIILYIPGHAFSRPLLYVSEYQIVSSGNVGDFPLLFTTSMPVRPTSGQSRMPCPSRCLWLTQCETRQHRSPQAHLQKLPNRA